MPRVIELYFNFTPKFRDNDKQKPEDQFFVTLSDLPESERISALNDLAEILPDLQPGQVPAQSNLSPKQSAELAKKQSEWAATFASKHIKSVRGLAVQEYGGKPVEVKTAADVIKYCPDLAVEVAYRLVMGASEEEEGKSESQSGSTPSETKQ